MKTQNNSLFQKKLIKKHLLVALGLLLYIAILQVSGIYSPLWFMSGIQMPTTGMSRAWIQAVQGNFKAAFAYHLLFPLGPVLAIVIYRYYLFLEKKDLNRAIMISVIFFIYQMFRWF